MKRLYITGSLADRIMPRISKAPSGCWNWNGAMNSNGYGQINFKKRRLLAHRVSFEVHVRKLQPGEQVLHSCDNPKCINPEHLFVGDPASNARDKVAKSRQAKGFKLPHTKLTQEQVEEIRRSNDSQPVLALRYGINQSTISRILNGLRRTEAAA